MSAAVLAEKQPSWPGGIPIPRERRCAHLGPSSCSIQQMGVWRQTLRGMAMCPVISVEFNIIIWLNMRCRADGEGARAAGCWTRRDA